MMVTSSPDPGVDEPTHDFFVGSGQQIINYCIDTIENRLYALLKSGGDGVHR